MIYQPPPRSTLPKIQPGDEIHLLAGDWEAIRFQQLAGTPEQPIIVKPAAGALVRCHSIYADNSCRHLVMDGMAMQWRIDGERVGALVLVHGNHCIVRNLWIGPDADPGQLTLTDGIELRAKHCVAQYNLVTQVRRGISLRGEHCSAEQNHVVAAHEDHVRSTQGATCIVNNILLDSVQGDPANHNDFIQGWDDTAPTPDEGVLRGWRVTNNLLRNSAEGTTPCQGIGAFNGWVQGAVIQDNTVITNHTLGICIGHDDDCQVVGNIVLGINHAPSLIRLRSAKAKRYPSAMTKTKDSVIQGNLSQGYDLRAGLKEFA